MTKEAKKAKELQPGATRFYFVAEGKDAEYIITQVNVKVGGVMRRVKVMVRIIQLDTAEELTIPADDILIGYMNGTIVFTA